MSGLSHTGDDQPTETAVETRLKAGDTVAGRFVVIRFLSRGGMGEVYEASDSHLQGKRHAIKTLRSEIATKEAFRQRFEREVLLAREINHPNVCPTYDLFQVHDANGPLTFLTMKLLQGESLQQRLRRGGGMPSATVLAIARQLASALDAAHRGGVVHCDLKPGNIMLDDRDNEPHVWVTDFGLARAFELDATATEPAHVLGTVGYMAPEVQQGASVSYQSDVYAFGVILYEMLTGQHPARAVGKPSFIPPSQLRPDIPGAWDHVVLRCLERDPEKRAASAGAALALLEHSGGASLWTRLRVAAILVAAVVSLGVAAWFGRDAVEDAFYPLPEKRFVALMAWPDAAGASPLLRRTLDTIASRLARAEATTSGFVVISAADIGGQASPRQPAEAARALGANLVLATSVAPAAAGTTITLLVLDATTSAELRRRQRTVPASELALVEDVASRLAADALNVDLRQLRWKDQDELASVPPSVVQEFMTAEGLANESNDAGLEQAIEQYQRVIEASPRFALAYAKLAQAYIRKYQKERSKPVLTLAARNADTAVRLNSDSMQAVLSRATVDISSGDIDAALAGLQRALELDPGNPEILMAKARSLRVRDRVQEEEEVYREIIRNRPNFWPAYDQRGLNLYRQARYAEAADAFKEGLAVAPRIVRLLNNLGAMQVLLKQRQEAAETYRRSVEVTPTATAYQNLGTLAFIERDYTRALEYYRKSSEINPRDDVAWRNIADAYAMLGDATRVVENYDRAASVAAEALKINPKRGELWMTSALYEAKLGRRTNAEQALQRAEALGATGMPSQFKKVQVLALLGRREEALKLLIDCVNKGQSLEDVELAIDLADLRRDPRYVRAVETVRESTAR